MSAIKRIDQIRVENIKGVAEATLTVSLLPNKPNLLVAPNGFGKSSLAVGFQSLRKTRLDLAKDHLHRDNENLEPLLKLTCSREDGTTFTAEATRSKNELSSYFDTFVINNQLVPKSKKLKISGHTIVTSSLEIEPVTLVSKVPPKAKFSYSYSGAKSSFGPNGKVLSSIDALLGDTAFVKKLSGEVDFGKSSGVRATAAVAALKAEINSLSGSSSAILSAVQSGTVSAVSGLPHIAKIVELIGTHGGFSSVSEIERVLAALQVSEMHDSDKGGFKKAAAWCEYQFEKDAYVQAFRSLKGTWKNIAPVEKKSELVVNFPPANRISNGERDIICFFAMLMKAKVKLSKQDSILIVDEVFDYLDDANLVAAQYYLSELIAEFKKAGRKLFLVIMTHLDPAYFKSYVFNKPNVTYLERGSLPNRDVEKIVVAREEPAIKEDVSRFFLHYDPGSIDLTTHFVALKLPGEYADSANFTAYVDHQLQQYLAKKAYDPISVCCAVRLRIEIWMYEALDVSLRPAYLATWKTVEKLEFGERNGIDVPDALHLLGIIYNSALHLRANHDNFTPLRSKLDNLTIRHMIDWAVKHCV